MVKEEKVQLGWLVPFSVRESFRDFCIDNGFVVQDDCAGALALWPYLPAAIREQAKLHAKGIESIDATFWDSFRAGLELALQAQPDTQPKKRKSGSHKK